MSKNIKVSITNNIPIPWSFKNQDPSIQEVSLDELAFQEDETRPKYKVIDPETRQRQKDEAKEIVRRLFEQVSPKEKQVLDLLQEGMGRKDIAGIMRVPANEVYQLLFRIRRKTERIIRRMSFEY